MLHSVFVLLCEGWKGTVIVSSVQPTARDMSGRLFVQNRRLPCSFVRNTRRWTRIPVHEAPLLKKKPNCIESQSLLSVIQSRWACTGASSSEVPHAALYVGLCPLSLTTYWSRGSVSLINRTTQPVCQHITHCTQEAQPPTLTACSSCCTC